MTKAEVLRRAQTLFWGAWIVLTFLFFEIRFSSIIYGQQKEFIDQVLTRLHIIQSSPASAPSGRSATPTRTPRAALPRNK